MSAQSVVYLAALSICIANLLWLAWRDWTDKDGPLSRGIVLVYLAAALVPVANAICAGCLVVCHVCRLTGVTLYHVQDWFEGPLFRRRRQ
jgi:hypothetical protein